MIGFVSAMCMVAAGAAGPASAAPPAGELQNLMLSGDFRLRYEASSASGTSPVRHRGVLRARLGARYDLSESLSLGIRLATGDPDDPNSSDVTLSDFADDLAVSLDQVYARFHRGSLDVYGGKIPNPFVRTELVWDGDVNPEGVTASWAIPTSGEPTARLTGLYFLVNEQAAAADSAMTGVQLGLASAKERRWSFELAAAYYDYRLAGLAGADAGDTRSNLLTADGSDYLSDFELVDVIGRVTLETPNPSWPIHFVADYVRNVGAATSDDTGYGLDVLWGRASAPHDLRFSYGHSVAETDAVLAAFGHDNTSLATNYRQHTLAADYVLTSNIVLTGTWYHYRPIDTGTAAAEWLDRIRLNVLVQF